MSRPAFQRLRMSPVDDPARDILTRMPESMIKALETVALATRQSRNAIIRQACAELLVRLYQGSITESTSDSLAEDAMRFDDTIAELHQALHIHTH